MGWISCFPARIPSIGYFYDIKANPKPQIYTAFLAKHMYVATSTMNQSTKAMIAFYLFAMALLAAISPSSGRLPLMYRRSVGLHHFEQTSALLSEYQDLATAMVCCFRPFLDHYHNYMLATQKEDVIKILNMSNVSLFEAPNEITEIRFSVNVTCQLKELLETLALSEAAITSDPGQEGGMDIELSAVVIVVGTLYKQSCSWVCCKISCFNP